MTNYNTNKDNNNIQTSHKISQQQRGSVDLFTTKEKKELLNEGLRWNLGA